MVRLTREACMPATPSKAVKSGLLPSGSEKGRLNICSCDRSLWRGLDNFTEHGMKKFTRIIGQSERVAQAVLFAAMISTPAALYAQADTPQDCKAMTDDTARLACYDALNSAAAPAPAPAPTPPPPEKSAQPPAIVDVVPEAEQPKQAEPVATVPEALSDDIGRERLGPKDGEELAVRAKVIRCREDLSSKFLFYFENGQVWKQKDNSRIRWTECNFEVTIKKDFFGYKMLVDGEKKKVRIARVE